VKERLPGTERFPRYDSVVISDVHLAAKRSNARQLLRVLHRLRKKHGFLRLIVAGDLVDRPGDFLTRKGKLDEARIARWPRVHRRLLKYLRKLHKRRVEVVWVEGNHDEGVHRVKHGRIPYQSTLAYEFSLAGRRFGIIHGHQFDRTILKRKWLAVWANEAFRAVQWLAGDRQARAKVIEQMAMMKRRDRLELLMPFLAAKWGTKHGRTDVICGHSHRTDLNREVNGIRYHNSGCWTDEGGTLLTIGHDGTVELHRFEK
jgi:UDP-2,3-diacylglucosamine pyrophosphatase LpxH